MKIGGVLVVKNEARLVQRCVRWHLDVLGLDHLVVVNNGSWDATVQKVQELGDARVLLRHTQKGVGFAQDQATLAGFRELVDRVGCDWVLPVDADELWISREHGDPRTVLASLPGEPLQLVTHSYLFRETESDDPAIGDPMLRLRWAGVESLTKLVLHREAVLRLKGLVIGNHTATYAGEEAASIAERTLTLAPPLLARLHYRFMGEQDYVARVLNQAEGFLLRMGERWLRGDNSLGGEHIRYMYQKLKKGEFGREYRARFVLSEAERRKREAEGVLERVDEGADLLVRHQLA